MEGVDGGVRVEEKTCEEEEEEVKAEEEEGLVGERPLHHQHLSFHQLEGWRKDNAFIWTHYRPELRWA